MATYLEQLQAKSREELINDAYNARIADWANYDESDKAKDKHGHGKRIPYIGWFWRYTDFIKKRIYIGDCGEFIGVMENNKWDYPERMMTEQEVDAFIAHLEAAYVPLSKGGNLAEMHAQAEVEFDKLWDWFQTLKIEG